MRRSPRLLGAALGTAMVLLPALAGFGAVGVALYIMWIGGRER